MSSWRGAQLKSQRKIYLYLVQNYFFHKYAEFPVSDGILCFDITWCKNKILPFENLLPLFDVRQVLKLIKTFLSLVFPAGLLKNSVFQSIRGFPKRHLGLNLLITSHSREYVFMALYLVKPSETSPYSCSLRRRRTY